MPTQTLTIALPVGGADRPHLRGVPAAVPDVRRPDAPHRVYHQRGRGEEDSEAHRRGLRAATHHPGTRATAVGGL